MKRVIYSKRVLATIIDIILAYTASYFLIEYKYNDINYFSKFLSKFDSVCILGNIILTVYLFCFYLLFNGTSLGRLFTNTHIVKINGKRMNIWDCLVRSLMQGIVQIIIFNLIYQLLNKTPQSLYDLTTNTRAVYIKEENITK